MPSVKLRAPRKQRHRKNVAGKTMRAKRLRAPAARRQAAPTTGTVVAYRSTKGVDDYVRQVARATPLELVEIERQGVLGSFIKDLSKRMEIPSSRIFAILGVPKATASLKRSSQTAPRLKRRRSMPRSGLGSGSNARSLLSAVASRLICLTHLQGSN